MMNNDQIDAIDAAIQAGTRVAIISADAKTFLGYGTYLGCVKPSPDDPAIIAIAVAAGFTDLRNVMPLPRVRLDTGAEMWGFEMWWGSCEPFEDAGYTEFDIGAEIRVRIEDGVQVIETLPASRLDVQ